MHADATNRMQQIHATFAGCARALLDPALTTRLRKTDSRHLFLRGAQAQSAL
jgi:hypothetical protein